MTKGLFFQAIAKFTLGVVLIGALIFLPAGTLDYPNGWLFLAILFVPMFLAGLVMMARNPALLRSRLQAKEQQGEQQLVVKLSGLMFLCGFIVAGLDFRFGWSRLPDWLVVLAVILFVISLPTLIGCFLFASGVILLVPLAVITLAWGILKICV
jgi:protein-S-isoprenylcysteine O-methyltransferase Ste14